MTSRAIHNRTRRDGPAPIETLEPRRLLSAAGVTTVLDNGPASNRIDLAVVGDGFTQTQIPTFAADVQTFIKGFFNEAPLSSYKSFFNVHEVNVVSNVSGVSGDPTAGVSRSTPLGMSFFTEGVERLLGVDTAAARQYAQSAPGDDQTIAIANSSKYGGAGYPSEDVLTFAGGNPSAVEIVKHEFGHSFGDLADEYDYGGPTNWPGAEPVEADISTYTAAEMVAKKVKWWRWIGMEGVGAYEGAEYSQHGVYRPTQDSKMRTLGQPYGPVDTEQLIEKMYDTVSPIDSATAAGTYPSNTTFSLKVVEPVDHLDAVQWYVDGNAIAGATGLSFDPAGHVMTVGSHTLSAKVEDMTTAVRDETFRSQHMTASRQWTISVGAPPADNTPPTAHYSGGSVTAGNAAYRFSVTYSDNVAVKVGTIDSSDVQVVNSAGGYSQIAKLVSVDHTTSGTPRTATYQITAPGGTWDAGDNGDYTIKLRASQVSDVAGHVAAAGTIGFLHVALPNTIVLSGRVF
ncbi:MAG TPA: M64 family metallopeptidase, partial [Tepidisphaeraceae bacterium]|nr:M64 family metallopeptidase [Tepidisphaeraceae bacterium]